MLSHWTYAVRYKGRGVRVSPRVPHVDPEAKSVKTRESQIVLLEGVQSVVPPLKYTQNGWSVFGSCRNVFETSSLSASLVAEHGGREYKIIQLSTSRGSSPIIFLKL